MPKPMLLKDLNGQKHPDSETWGTHCSIIQQAQASLLEIWNGEYDNLDTVVVLESVADRLRTLAKLIQHNHSLDDEELDTEGKEYQDYHRENHKIE